MGLISGLSARQFNSCLPRREDEEDEVVGHKYSRTVEVHEVLDCKSMYKYYRCNHKRKYQV